MSDLISQNLNMIFKTPKGETVHALKNVKFYTQKRRAFNSSWSIWMWEDNTTNISPQVFLDLPLVQLSLVEMKINGPGVERGMVFQQGALFEWLTVAENVNFWSENEKRRFS